MKNLVFTLIAIGFATVAFGQETNERKRMSKEEMFSKLDTNGDAVVSLSEFTSFERPQRPQREGAEQREPKSPQDIFNKIDADGDGLISQEEFSSAKGRKGKKGEKGRELTDEQKAERKTKREAMKAKIVAADVNGDKRLSFAEFSTITFDREINLQEKFERLDTNGDGYLEKGEMKRKNKKGKKAEKGMKKF